MRKDPEKIKKHSIVTTGHATSISMDNAFWDRLCAFADNQNLSRNELISKIDDDPKSNLSSSIRIFVLHHSNN